MASSWPYSDVGTAHPLPAHQETVRKFLAVELVTAPWRTQAGRSAPRLLDPLLEVHIFDFSGEMESCQATGNAPFASTSFSSGVFGTMQQ